MMIRIELTMDEARVLHETLGRYVSDLGMEIADTDRMDFREGLKAERDALRRVMERLAHSLGGGKEREGI